MEQEIQLTEHNKAEYPSILRLVSSFFKRCHHLSNRRRGNQNGCQNGKRNGLVDTSTDE